MIRALRPATLLACVLAFGGVAMVATPAPAQTKQTDPKKQDPKKTDPKASAKSTTTKAGSGKPDPKKPDPKKAEAKPEQKQASAAGGVKPVPIDKVNDWGIYAAGAGKAKTCYALAEPKERAPKNLQRDPGYVFISNRPGEGVRNEVSIVMGFEVKPDSTPKAEIGTASFDMIAKGANLWVKNAAEETQFVAALRKAPRLVVKAASKKGNVTTDTYQLSGVGPALDRAAKECP